VNNGATLAPGAGSTGRLTINNNLTFVSGATLNLNINSNTPMTGYDQVFDTGTVTLGNASLTLTLGYAPNERANVYDHGQRQRRRCGRHIQRHRPGRLSDRDL